MALPLLPELPTTLLAPTHDAVPPLSDEEYLTPLMQNFIFQDNFCAEPFPLFREEPEELQFDSECSSPEGYQEPLSSAIEPYWSPTEVLDSEQTHAFMPLDGGYRLRQSLSCTSLSDVFSDSISVDLGPHVHSPEECLGSKTSTSLSCLDTSQRLRAPLGKSELVSRMTRRALISRSSREVSQARRSSNAFPWLVREYSACRQ